MIEKSSVFHRPTDQFVYPYHEDLLHIRIKTKKGNVTSIILIYGDQYEWVENQWKTNSTSLVCTGSDSLFDYWQAEVTPPFKRLRYGFSLNGHTETIFYTEKGFFVDPPKDPNHYFCYPYLHSSEIFRAPEWVRDTIWYQIFPERFANGDQSLNPKGTKPWGSEEPSSSNFFGGDFCGIIKKLDYLKELGITGIYLTPIFKACTNHKYDTIDYYELDPQFGDKNTFRKLIEKCHENGIRVMLDAVFNHCGFYFPAFQDVWQHGEKSVYKDWFHISQYPLKGGDHPNYATFSFVETMPKLNTQNEVVKQYLLDVACYWIREFNIDGWRLDVANEIDHAFWREFRSAVKSLKPDIYILGEIWHDSMPWLRGDQFDAVMNYPFLMNTIQFFAKEMLSSSSFIEQMTSCFQQYPDNINESLLNLVGSHDTPRLLSECSENIEKAKLIYTFLLTFIGSPCIYYGDEIGLTGGMDPGCRKCMSWDGKEQKHELFNHIKKLIALRKKEPLLANKGRLRFLHMEKGIAYVKSSHEQLIIVMLNPTDKELKYTLPYNLSGTKITDLLMDQEYMMESDELTALIPPKASTILQFSTDQVMKK